MATTAYNLQQKKDRLNRMIAHFQLQMEKFDSRDTPQVKRCWTRARNAMLQRKRLLSNLFPG